MVAGWLTDWIQYRDENRKLRQQVAELSWDEPFGMLTRPAFIQYCRGLQSKPRWVAFIDLNSIGSLNLLHGYTEVDRRIRSVFADFRKCRDITARWYSGDEIVILFGGSRNPQAKMMDLVSRARQVGLEFIFETGVWDARLESIESAINTLSGYASSQKYNLKDKREVSYEE
ncbi:MAG TPA: GGDEF domain-containing protein [Anaerolineales bacterium]|nr:GGDEF domain-containing protein [Anaerolineales bacterium]